MSDGGKGSRQRPTNTESFAAGWERIFHGKPSFDKVVSDTTDRGAYQIAHLVLKQELVCLNWEVIEYRRLVTHWYKQADKGTPEGELAFKKLNAYLTELRNAKKRRRAVIRSIREMKRIIKSPRD